MELAASSCEGSSWDVERRRDEGCVSESGLSIIIFGAGLLEGERLMVVDKVIEIHFPSAG